MQGRPHGTIHDAQKADRLAGRCGVPAPCPCLRLRPRGASLPARSRGSFAKWLLLVIIVGVFVAVGFAFASDGSFPLGGVFGGGPFHGTIYLYDDGDSKEDGASWEIGRDSVTMTGSQGDAGGATTTMLLGDVRGNVSSTYEVGDTTVYEIDDPTAADGGDFFGGYGDGLSELTLKVLVPKDIELGKPSGKLGYVVSTKDVDGNCLLWSRVRDFKSDGTVEFLMTLGAGEDSDEVSKADPSSSTFEPSGDNVQRSSGTWSRESDGRLRLSSSNGITWIEADKE